MREPDITITVEFGGVSYDVPSAVIPALGPRDGYWPMRIVPEPPDEHRPLIYAAAFQEWDRRIAEGTQETQP